MIDPVDARREPVAAPEPAATAGFVPGPIVMLEGVEGGERRDRRFEDDPGALVRTCANCGAAMDERKCKLICRCGYFLSCSDYY